MIEGIIITPLRQIHDERGKVMHMLREDMSPFVHFGEIYFSCVLPTAVKAWKRHRLMTLNCAVPHGQVKFVVYDDRPDSLTCGEIQEIELGQDDYCLLTVPPGVWTGFMGIATEMSILSNCATVPHDPDECERRELADPYFPYAWV